ncbi:unnamed protein product [Allacma fusca]|uniref:Mpv17-like protein 2 n=1 Tax=Allacma fusca TaxID=39272 RepID=A0A8J2JED2_9HEXA|nr:unnamed protein product [Allacma fusca]
MSFISKISKLGQATSVLFHGKHALTANTVSGGALFLIGDFVEQRVEVSRGKLPEFDWMRFGRMGVIGVLLGPTHHYFYKYLDVLIPRRDGRSIFKKIMADQLIACPMFSVQFFMGMAYLEGKSLPECWGEFKKKFPTVYAVDWTLWPPIQLINFYYIPTGFRVLYVNTMTAFWNVFLSYMKHYDQLQGFVPTGEGFIAESKNTLLRFLR